MTPRTTDTAVIDRIVDGDTAVLLLETEGDVTDEVTLGIDRVPAAGQHEGAVLELTVERSADGEVNSVVDMQYREEETETRRERARDRFDRLSERLSDRD